MMSLSHLLRTDPSCLAAKLLTFSNVYILAGIRKAIRNNPITGVSNLVNPSYHSLTLHMDRYTSMKPDGIGNNAENASSRAMRGFHD